MTRSIFVSRFRLFFALLLVLYFLSHLINLTQLPVFADEAIYIRWAQLAKNEPDKYLFYPMLDGKPPLHAWLIIPFLEVFSDPLLASRFLSVIIGFLTIITFDQLIKLLGGNSLTRLFATLVIIITPYWFFHHRMGLAEALLAFSFTLSLYVGLKLMYHPSIKNLFFFTLSFAISLWTKTNSLFFIPSLALIPLLFLANTNQKLSFSNIKKTYHSKPTFFLAIAGFLGLILFLLLKFTPLFSFLFTRSVDYTFTFSEIINGQWRYILKHNLPVTLYWLIWYLTPFLALFMFLGKRQNIILALMALSYISPLIIMGRVIAPRYFFPSAIFFTLMAVFGFKQIVNKKKLKKFIAPLLSLFIIFSLRFDYFSVFNPDNTPFVPIDKTQYLTEWSSGHGIPQVRDYIKSKDRTQKITVATEGFFGTLPDGLLMYFDRRPTYENVEVYGVGQPITTISPQIIKSASSPDREVYLIVNSHRFHIDPLPEYMEKIDEFPRPYNGPSLLFFRIYPKAKT